jgi:GT2 family glycosyltransferase
MKQSYPLISVIIPIHNFEDYVLLSIKSIQNQSYKNIEIIIIDDTIDNNLNSSISKLRAIKLVFLMHSILELKIPWEISL